MNFPLLFTPEEGFPDMLLLRPGILLSTGAQFDEEGRWTRFVRGHYHPERGFLATDTVTRIRFEVCTEHPETYERHYLQDYPQASIAEQLNPYLEPNTLTAIHYYPSVRVCCLMTNLASDTEDRLPRCLKYPYGHT